jgi:hypothetical protein
MKPPRKIFFVAVSFLIQQPNSSSDPTEHSTNYCTTEHSVDINFDNTTNSLTSAIISKKDPTGQAMTQPP